MSGGFFRGTTADQDTRFSNKQAKLMKSHKFPPELEHIVDMSKVKMDVVRPWIAKRVTELLGFEDEVLINFIYGLLDGKNVNGKEIQISITGFMEKNTGKFMRELWTLLLSAQKNASGVPQQFLDEKEEETKKKMAESERITSEIQRKKERKAEESGFDQMMEGGFETSRLNATSDKPFSNRRNGRELSHSPDERNEIVGRNGRDRKTRFSISPHSTGSSPSPCRSSSRSPKARKRSISTGRERPNQRKSISPHRSRLSRRSPSLSRRRSSYRRRSRSSSRSCSLSPQRFRSHRNTSPRARRRRSPPPMRHRSPPRRSRRSPTPVRRRSPPRRSPSPVRRRSPPSRSRSPARRGSRAMIRRQSLSPVQDKSPLLPQRRGSTSSPSQGATPSPKHTSLSPHRRRSPPPRNRLAPPIRSRTSPVAHERYIQKSPKAHRSRYRGQSPDSHKSIPSDGRKMQSPDSRPLSPDRSASVSPLRRTSISPSRGKSPTHMKKQIISSSKINHRLVRESHKKSNFSRGDESFVPKKEEPPKEIYQGKIRSSKSPANRSYNEDELRALNSSKREESKIRKESPPLVNKENYSAKENASHEIMGKSANAVSSDSGFDDGKKRKHRGSSSKHEVTSDEDSSDVDANETKDARRKRKKEEKRLRREKRRLRHEEKRRKKEEKRSEKHKSRKDDDSSVSKKVYEKSDVEEEDEENKKQLEIELRKKALESLKAKKGFSQ